MPKVKTPKVKKPTYKLTLKVNEQVFESDNQNLADGLRSIMPILIKTKALVKVEYDGKVAEKMILGALQCRKLRNIKTYAELFIKSLLVGLH